MDDIYNYEGTPKFTERGRVAGLPVIFLWPYSGCDCRCVMCDIGKDHTRRRLEVDDLTQWLPEWVEIGVERVEITGGEALLHPQIWTICDLIREAGIDVELLSTGLTVKRHVENIVSHCEALTLSLDGPKIVHNRIRNVPLAYDLLAKSMKALRSLDQDFEVIGRCTVQLTNYQHLRETVDAAHELGFTRISFLASDVSSIAFNRDEPWSEEKTGTIALGIDDLPRLGYEIQALSDEYSDDFQSGFIMETPQQLTEKLLDYFTALCGRGQFPPISCNAPWKSAVVKFDGTVQPCFFHPAYGVVGEGGFAELLNGKQATEFRANLDVLSNATCERCVCTMSLGG